MSLWKIRKMKIVIKFFYFLKILFPSFLNTRLISVSENVITSLQYDPLVSLFGEGNNTPLQYSCLENPRDGGAWWAAVCGVTQSRTRLK